MAELGISYRLVTPLGTLEFNDYASASYYRLTQVSGMDCGTIRANVVDRPQRDSALVSNAYEGALYPMFRGQIKAGVSLTTRRTMEDTLRSRLKSMLRANGTLSWLPSGSAVRRQRVVRLHEKFDIPGEPGQVIKTFLFSLVAADPLAYSETEQSTLWFIGAGGADSLATITNGGTAATWPRVRIYGPANTILIKNDTTGAQMYFPGLVLGAEYVEISMREETMYRSYSGGVLQYLDPATSSFWSLSPGANVIRFSVLSGANAASTQAIVYWRDAWDG